MREKGVVRMIVLTLFLMSIGNELLAASDEVAFHCPASTGVYPDPTNNTRFFECVDGNSVQHLCDSDTVFDTTVQGCLKSTDNKGNVTSINAESSDEPTGSSTPGATYQGHGNSQTNEETVEIHKRHSVSTFQQTTDSVNMETTVSKSFNPDVIPLVSSINVTMATSGLQLSSNHDLFPHNYPSSITILNPTTDRKSSPSTTLETTIATKTMTTSPVTLSYSNITSSDLQPNTAIPQPEAFRAELQQSTDEDAAIDPRPEESFICPNESGFFRHPTNCSRFFWCISYEPNPMFCSEGTAFDPATHVCSWIVGSDGCGGMLSAPTHEKFRRRRPPRDTRFSISIPFSGNNIGVSDEHERSSEVILSRTGRHPRQVTVTDSSKRERSEDNDSNDTSKKGRSYGIDSRGMDFSTSPIEFQCPGDGFYADPNDCRIFYHCSNGVAYKHQCQPGTAFNRDKYVCSWPVGEDGCGGMLSVPYSNFLQEEMTSSSSQGTNHFRCLETDGYYSDPDDCQAFHHCANGVAYRHVCGEGTAFNEEQGVCSWPLTESGCGSVLGSAYKAVTNNNTKSQKEKPSSVLKSKIAMQAATNFKSSINFETKASADGQNSDENSNSENDNSNHTVNARMISPSVSKSVLSDILHTNKSKDNIFIETRTNYTQTDDGTRDKKAVLTVQSTTPNETVFYQQSREWPWGEPEKLTIGPAKEKPEHSTTTELTISKTVSPSTVAFSSSPEASSLSSTTVTSSPGASSQSPITVTSSPGASSQSPITVTSLTTPLSSEVSTENNNVTMTMGLTSNSTTEQVLSEVYKAAGSGHGFRCPSPSGHFRDPSNCAVYYHCAGGVAYRMDCPDGQLYDVRKYTCLPILQVKDCRRADDGNNFEFEEEWLRTYPEETSYPGKKDVLDSFQCYPVNGFFSHPTDCSLYIECVNGVAYKHRCMPGTVYDAKRRKCTWQSLVSECRMAAGVIHPESENLLSEPLTFECPTPDGYYRHRQSCTLYIHCIDSKPLLRKCDPNLFFDLHTSTCRLASLVRDCDNFGKPSFVEKLPLSSFVCPLPNGHFADPKNCRVFYHCLHDIPYKGECRKGKAFDADVMKCKPRNEVPVCGATQEKQQQVVSTVRDTTPEDTTVKMLEDEKPYPEETHHAPASNDATFECPSPHGTYRDPSDCRVFYQCYYGHAFRQVCSADTVFSTEKSLCTWPNLVPECQNTSQEFQQISFGTSSWTEAPESSPEVGIHSAPTVADDYVSELKEDEPGDWKTLGDEIPYNTLDKKGDTPTKDANPESKVFDYDLAEAHVPDMTSDGTNVFVLEAPSPSEDSKALGLTQTSSHFVCPPFIFDQYFRDPLDCTRFYRCVKGTRFSFDCPKGTFFEPVYSICDFQEKVPDCDREGRRLGVDREHTGIYTPVLFPGTFPISGESQSEPAPADFTSSKMCPKSDGLFPHPSSCRKFVYCSRDRPVVLTCPSDLLYNRQTMTCDSDVLCVRIDK